MFHTGIYSTVTGFSTSNGAINKYAPDGAMIVEFALGVGDGSERYPTMWVKVVTWENLAEQVLKVIDRKGIRVEATGWLQVRQYEGKHGRAVEIGLKNTTEVRIYDREGELEKVLSGKEAE